MPDDVPTVELPDLTTEQMREVDRAMVEEVGVTLPQMMENAGRGLAELTVARYAPATCVVLAGRGGNGGGGLAAARHLHNRGCAVRAVVSVRERLTTTTAHQLDILQRMGVPVVDEPDHPDRDVDLVVDAVLGYGVDGDPRGRAAELVRWANAMPAPVLALDGPSGLDLATGRVGDPCVVADATLTLALPKVGLRRAPQVVGILYAADISVPPALYERFGLRLRAPFAAAPVVRVR